MTDFDTQMLSTARELSDLGFSLHWLHKKEKRPKGEKWQYRPFQNFAQLSSGFVSRDNLGVRLGEPSRLTDGSYLHVIDADIRVPELQAEALAALHDLLGDTDALPMVRSGSGGASFHLYFVTDKPFRSKKLAQSDGKFRGPEGSWHRDWELELFGTGKQVVLPPSIHPCGKPYVWEREFDEFTLCLDDSYQISSDVLARLAVPDDATYEYETVSPLDFKAGRMESLLDDVPVSDLDYDDWLRLGQALHHQLGGTEEGFQLWLKHTERSQKHDNRPATVRTMRMKWRSFGKYRGRPVTMASISQWAQEARLYAMVDEFEDLEDEDGESTGTDVETDEADEFEGLFDTNVGSDSASVGSRSDRATDADESDPFTPEPGLKWQSLLDVSEEGGIKGTLPNMELIVANDPRIKGVMGYNEFTQETVQRAEPGVMVRRKKAAKPTRQLEGNSWKLEDPINGDFWTEDKDNSIRSVIESPKTQGGYGVKATDRDLKAAIDNVSRKNPFHPVREYLHRLTWDGTPRVERLFIDYLGAPDDSYHRTIARLMLVAAVTRVHEPGHKWDTAIILEGLQGKRKSTFISTLANGWFVELDGDITDTKQIVELMQGAWIVELNELGGLAKADVRHIKAFISRRSDKVRLAYAKRAAEYRRQSILIGSTNDDVYLKDNSGGRRFLPVRCAVDQINTEKLAVELDQIWAEAYAIYAAMRKAQPRGQLPLYIADAEARETAETMQKSRTVDSSEEALAGRIEEWLNKPAYDGDITSSEHGVPINEVCLLQIWCECLGREESQYTAAWPALLGRSMRMVSGWKESSRRPRFGKYGQQRAFVRT